MEIGVLSLYVMKPHVWIFTWGTGGAHTTGSGRVYVTPTSLSSVLCLWYEMLT
jgi:hypothetical protein